MKIRLKERIIEGSIRLRTTLSQTPLKRTRIQAFLVTSISIKPLTRSKFQPRRL